LTGKRKKKTHKPGTVGKEENPGMSEEEMQKKGPSRASFAKSTGSKSLLEGDHDAGDGKDKNGKRGSGS